MNCKVDENIIRQLTEVVGQLLYVPEPGFFLSIEKFEIEKRVKFGKDWLFRPVEKTTLWVTNLVLWAYDYDRDYWGTIEDDDIKQKFITFYDLIKYRDMFRDRIQKPLQISGMIQGDFVLDNIKIKKNETARY